MSIDAPRCARLCGRPATYDDESGTWFSDCSTCTAAYCHVMPGGERCVHFGHTAGLLAPAHATNGGEHVGWLCTGAGNDACGRFYGLDESEIIDNYMWNVHMQRPGDDTPVPYSIGYTTELDARNRIERHRTTLPTETEWYVVEVFADGFLVGQTARATRV